MVDNNTSPENSASAEAETVSKGVPDGFIPRDKFDSELGEAIKRRDGALKRAREAEAKLAEIEEQALETRRKKAESEGNTDEQKKLFQFELKKREEMIESLQSELSSHILENKIKSKLAGYTDYLEDSWNLLANNFSVEKNEEGKYVPTLKSNPFASIDDYLKGFFESKPFLAKNPRKSGAGVPLSGPTHPLTGGGSISFEALDAMTKVERQPYLAKDSELKNKYLRHQLEKARGQR